ncbi:MAG TPA: hypothetical protein IGS37_17925 [Synechococcales cyanobacterium M55_K2018_004]|nr:hypothetical protein [Synechococcales cyanobacterium M55_K2018_004]
MNQPGDLSTRIQQGYSVRTESYISRGWTLFTSHLGGFIGFAAFNLALSLALGLAPVIGPLVSFFLSIGLTAGYYIVAIKLSKREPTEFRDFFQGFNQYVPLLAATLLMVIFLAIGFLLFFLPGIYLAVSYLFVIPLIVDRRLGPLEALETSRKVVTRQWFSVFLFVFLLGLLMLVVALPFILFAFISGSIGDPQSPSLLFSLIISIPGLVLTPFMFCTYVVAYEDIIGFAASSETRTDGM